jgi:hypothetical protein
MQLLIIPAEHPITGKCGYNDLVSTKPTELQAKKLNGDWDTIEIVLDESSVLDHGNQLRHQSKTSIHRPYNQDESTDHERILLKQNHRMRLCGYMLRPFNKNKALEKLPLLRFDFFK